MRARTWGWLGVGFTAGLLAPAACGVRTFVCEQDGECEGSPGGQCEAIGHCSFPDDACPSGRRYAEHSGDFSGRCVTASDDDGGTAGDTGGGTGGDAAGSSSHGDELSTTLALEDSSGSSGPAATDTGDPTSGWASTSDDGSSTGNSVGGMCPGPLAFEEPFDQWPLPQDVWTTTTWGMATGSAPGGIVTVGVSVPPGGPVSYIDLTSLEPLGTNTATGLEVLGVPEASLPAELVFGVIHQPITYGFDIYEDHLVTFQRVEPSPSETRTSIPFDGDAHHWLRLSVDGEGALTWETSADAIEWEARDVEPSPVAGFDAAAANVLISCGAWEGPAVADTLCEYDNAFVCG